jgi:hypothetical protein
VAKDASWFSRLVYVASPALVLSSACVDIFRLAKERCPTGA